MIITCNWSSLKEPSALQSITSWYSSLALLRPLQTRSSQITPPLPPHQEISSSRDHARPLISRLLCKHFRLSTSLYRTLLTHPDNSSLCKRYQTPSGMYRTHASCLDRTLQCKCLSWSDCGSCATTLCRVSCQIRIPRYIRTHLPKSKFPGRAASHFSMSQRRSLHLQIYLSPGHAWDSWTIPLHTCRHWRRCAPLDRELLSSSILLYKSLR